ncbi:hypothetical protein JTB14_000300 [Gonioctena quinquepunctata]|nr:hypothetical protein JTB14_000300 [Gonioctena quinquepunctata]
MESLIKSVIEHLNEKIDEILKGQQEKFQEYDQKISSLSDKNKSSKRKVDHQEQYQIKNNIRNFGVEESDGEILEDVVHNLLNKTLKVKINVGPLSRSKNHQPVGRLAEQRTPSYTCSFLLLQGQTKSNGQQEISKIQWHRDTRGTNQSKTRHFDGSCK